MSFEAPRTLGLLEKASQLAVKYGLVYNAKERVFRGDPSAVTKATAQFDKWCAEESLRQRKAEREW